MTGSLFYHYIFKKYGVHGGHVVCFSWPVSETAVMKPALRRSEAAALKLFLCADDDVEGFLQSFDGTLADCRVQRPRARAQEATGPLARRGPTQPQRHGRSLLLTK